MGTFDDILNFIIPPAVYAFLIYLIYRIPIVTEGVSRLKDWWLNKREKNTGTETTTLRSISYEWNNR